MSLSGLSSPRATEPNTRTEGAAAPDRIWSEGSRGGGSGGRHERCQERPYALVDLVADLPDGVDGPAARIGELPVEVALARVDRAGVAAAKQPLRHASMLTLVDANPAKTRASRHL